MQKNNKAVLYIEIIFYLAIICIYPFLFIRYGVDYTDSAYHYMAYSGQTEIPLFTFLDSILGNLCMRLTSNSFISYRFIAKLLTIIMHIIPFIFIPGIVAPLNDKLRFLAVCLIFNTAVSFNMLCYDLFSGFFLSLIFTVGFIYAKKPYLWAIPLLGILSAIIAAVRLPSIIVIVPILFMLIGRGIIDKRKSVRILANITIYIMVLCGTYYLLWSQLYISKYRMNNLGYVISSFTPMKAPSIPVKWSVIRIIRIIPNYFRDGFELFEIMLILTFIVILLKSLKKRGISELWQYTITIIFLLVYMSQSILLTTYNRQLSLFYDAIFILITIYLIFWATKKKEKGDILAYAFALFCCSVAACGSDTGLLKLIYGCSFMIPVFLTVFYNSLMNSYRKYFNIFVILVVILSITNTYISKTYQDRRPFRMHSFVNHPKLKGILTTEKRKEHIEEIIDSINELKKVSDRDIVFYGTCSLLFNYLNGEKQLYSQPFLMGFSDIKESQRIKELITNCKKLPYFILIYGNSDQPDIVNDNLINSTLINYGYDQYKEGYNYQIYSPRDISPKNEVTER